MPMCVSPTRVLRIVLTGEASRDPGEPVSGTHPRIPMLRAQGGLRGAFLRGHFQTVKIHGATSAKTPRREVGAPVSRRPDCVVQAVERVAFLVQVAIFVLNFY
jgi:hypothetical protein